MSDQADEKDVSPVVRLSHKILETSKSFMENGLLSVRITPGEDGCSDVTFTFNINFETLLTRLMVMSGMDIGDQNQSQTGSIKVDFVEGDVGEIDCATETEVARSMKINFY